MISGVSKALPEVRVICGPSMVETILGSPVGVKVHLVPYQKHLFRFKDLPVAYSSHSQHWAVICIRMIAAVTARPSLSNHREVSSTKASPVHLVIHSGCGEWNSAPGVLSI